MSSPYPELNKALHAKYSEVAYQEEIQKDYADETHYTEKSEMAINGLAVRPDQPETRQIPATEASYAEQTYQRIISAYDNGAPTEHPEDLATAQVAYDCWLEQQEEGYQLLHIQRCRDTAEQALAAIEQPATAMAEPAPAAEPQPPQRYTILFDLDSADVETEQMSVIEDALTDFRGRENGQIDILGHADRSGPPDYNQQLSARRADTVTRMFANRGIEVGRIDESAFGEQQPAVPTPDGVTERRNRRVVVVVQGG